MARALTALSIGPLDPSGRDGVLTDLKTFSALGLHGAAAITTFAETQVPAASVASQLRAVLGAIRVDVVKLTCPDDAALLDAIASSLLTYDVRNLVLDPAAAPLNPDALPVLKARLLPFALVVLPNIPEASALAQRKIDTWEEMREAALAIAALGPANVVIKGGKRAGNRVTDLLFDGTDYRDYTAERIDNTEILGSGTTFAAAVAATLAKGETVQHSVATAKAYVTKALQSAYELGDAPALHHFYRYWQPSAPGSLAPDDPEAYRKQ